ncbi:Chemotaxis protein CheA [Pirellula sp. SH-Sr6A]|uniref:hybrid sensor histidine kinase/response regulator n=1 Tax=Pirellula sp. SH-Sr6A TaxID=1632865 RepID=UPI00078B826E|nr:hybrid sensor histidine kinase/response regulator [Pirellula sp. SH-Sr6A]AMV31442.1 Chemotaxis protein CheA [Pirellula sp. SH-Sr6A]
MPTNSTIKEDASFLEDFVLEATTSMDLVDRHLVTLESHANQEILNEVFRAIHSIKGVAGFLGFEKIQRLSHEMESVLDKLRRETIEVSTPCINILLQANDHLRTLVEKPDVDLDLGCTIQSLASLHRNPTATTIAMEIVPAIDKSLSSVQTLLESEELPLIPSRHNASHNVIARPTTLCEATLSSTSIPHPSKLVSESSIRVPVAVLEELVNLAGELVLSRNQLVRTIDEYKLKALASIGTRIDQVTTAMQDAIMHARMQQVGLLFSRFPRLVRDLNQKLCKRCRLVVEGAEVELDKTVLEALSDPLTHIIRNALDHGIESQEDRRSAGKEIEGTLQLRAMHEGGKVRIIIQDDGKGMNRERILRKAIERGLISHDESLRFSERDITNLVFRPGFSTADSISDVSGRGVGMDVVRTNIERIGGTVDIESEFGHGTTISITLPLTLAIVPSWIVCQDRFQFAIPEANVIEFLSFSEGELDDRIDRIEGVELIRWRGNLLPLVRLRDCLPPECRSNLSPQRINKVVVIETGSFRFGLAVEQVRDPEHVVVKPVSSHLRQCGYLDGAAVLGDGNVAFILGMQGIAERAKLGKMNTPLPMPEVAADLPCDESQAAIIVRRENGHLAAIPRMVIQRIERVDPRDIQFANHQWIVPYRGGQLQVLEWERNSIRRLVKQGCEFCYVMVFTVRETEIGFLVREIVDIRDIPTMVRLTDTAQHSVVGTVLLQNTVVEMLDLYQFADQALETRGKTRRNRANCRTNLPAQSTNESFSLNSSDDEQDWSRYTILLAEDTPFFNNQIKRFLEQAGLKVVTACDGQEAWEILDDVNTKFDLLLTDIEMPRMTGFELSLKIRSCPRLQDLPIVAVTSLHTDAAQRRGRDVGIDAWQIKLDRDRLVQCLQSKLILLDLKQANACSS